MLCPHVGEFAKIDTSGDDRRPPQARHLLPARARARLAHAGRHARSRSRLQRAWSSCASSTTARCRSRRPRRQLTARSTPCVAKFLVGADGANSTVRAAIGQDFDGNDVRGGLAHRRRPGRPGRFDHVEFLCDPERPTPHMVAPGGRTRWEFMLQPGETPRGDGEGRDDPAAPCAVGRCPRADDRAQGGVPIPRPLLSALQQRSRLPGRRRRARYAAVRRVRGSSQGCATRRTSRGSSRGSCRNALIRRSSRATTRSAARTRRR